MRSKRGAREPRVGGDDVREALGALGNVLAGVVKDTGMRALEAAADVVLEEVQTRIEDAGERVGRVRRRARRAPKERPEREEKRR